LLSGPIAVPHPECHKGRVVNWERINTSPEPIRSEVVSADERINRRRFLRWVSGLGVLVSGAIVGLPVVRAFVAPARAKAPAADWLKVADDIALIDIDVPVRVDFVNTLQDAWVESRTQNAVWLFTQDGETFKAYNGKCTHLGCGFFYDDKLKTFACPCHRGQFDVKTGAVLAGPPPRSLDELEVEVRDAAVYVKYKDFQLGTAEKVQV
jgi:menaquinol-cytochrome c reductase iron-sulfur subunit